MNIPEAYLSSSWVFYHLRDISLLYLKHILLIFDTINDQIAKARRSMKHDEVVIARRAVEEGRGLVVIVNKMDLLSGKQNKNLYAKVMEAVPLEIQTNIPQVGRFMIKLHNLFLLVPGIISSEVLVHKCKLTN